MSGKIAGVAATGLTVVGSWALCFFPVLFFAGFSVLRCYSSRHWFGVQ